MIESTFSNQKTILCLLYFHIYLVSHRIFFFFGNKHTYIYIDENTIILYFMFFVYIL